jgi:hypothetical protein
MSRSAQYLRYLIAQTEQLRMIKIYRWGVPYRSGPTHCASTEPSSRTVLPSTPVDGCPFGRASFSSAQLHHLAARPHSPTFLRS